MQGISKRVARAIEELQRNEPLEALYQICSAIEETAHRVYGRGGRSAYKQFIQDNLRFITGMGMQVGMENWNMEFSHPELKPDAQGMVTFGDIIYHVVRCGLYHRTEASSDLSFSTDGTLSLSADNKLVLPAGLVFGLVMAVVCSPANVDERVDDNVCLIIAGVLPIPINCVWGKREELLWLKTSVRIASPVPWLGVGPNLIR